MKSSRRIFAAITSGFIFLCIGLCIGLFFGFPELRALSQSAWQRWIAPPQPISRSIAAPKTTPPSANATSSSEILKLEGEKEIETERSYLKSEKAIRLQEIKELLSKDEACQLLQRNELYDLDKEDLVQLLDGKLTTAADLLIDPSRLANYSPARDMNARKFLYALYIGDLLDGVPKPKALQLKKSYRLLSQLTSDDPKNGIYLYFRAAVRSKLKQPSDSVKDDLIQMAETSGFGSPLLNVSKEIHEWGLQSSSQFIISLQATRVLPNANYLPSMHLIKELLNEPDDHFRVLIFEWAQRVVRKNAEASAYKEFVHWFALEMQIGITLGRNAWMKNHPDQEIPKELSKSYKDYIDIDPFKTKWSKTFTDPEHCDENAIHDLLDSQIRHEESWRPTLD
ncbi:MAG: hypothetical protein ACJ763_02095 [Bdellovibrionia bacterium]